LARKKLGEILIQAGVLDELKLRAALGEQQRWGGPLGKILIDMKFISEDALVQALSHQLNFPAVRLEGREIPQRALDLVPIELCVQHTLIPIGIDGKFLDVAMADPTNLSIIDDLRIKTRLNVRAYLAGPRTIENAIQQYYRGIGGLALETLEPSPFLPAQSQMIDFEQKYAMHPAHEPLLGAGPDPVSTPVLQMPPAREPVGSGEIAQLKARIEQLEALLARDEDVLRKLLAILIQKGICTRQEILEHIK
jgi:Type II secretion system (T2SS), protein E, N-terminal domain